MSKYNIKCWCGTMVESVPMLLGYFDEKGCNHDPNECELSELRKLRNQVVAVGDGNKAFEIYDPPTPMGAAIARARELKRIGEGSREGGSLK